MVAGEQYTLKDGFSRRLTGDVLVRLALARGSVTGVVGCIGCCSAHAACGNQHGMVAAVPRLVVVIQGLIVITLYLRATCHRKMGAQIPGFHMTWDCSLFPGPRSAWHPLLLAGIAMVRNGRHSHMSNRGT